MSNAGVASNYSIPIREISNLTTSGPGLCGIPLSGPLNKTEVVPNEYVTVVFSDLRGPYRVFGSVNNRVALTTSPAKLAENPDLQCMRPFDIPEGSGGFNWQVIDKSFSNIKGNGTVGVGVGDFVWFHAQPLATNDTGDGVRFYTSKNYTVVNIKSTTSGSVPAVSKSGLMLLAGVAISSLLALAC